LRVAPRAPGVPATAARTMLRSATMGLHLSGALSQKRTAAVLIVFSTVVSISCFGQPTFSPVRSTPYDRQMIRVHPILSSPNEKSPGPLALGAVNEWMTQLRAIPYQFTRYWKTPAEVNFGQTADCKGKAIALYAQLRRRGAQRVRILIGKRHIYDVNTHAWVQWETAAGSYTLDPTFSAAAVRTTELDPTTYVAFYAFDDQGKYRAGRSNLIAPNTRVAAGYNGRVNRAMAPTGVAQWGCTKFGSPQFYAAAPQPWQGVPPTRYTQRRSQNSLPQPQASVAQVAGSVSHAPVTPSNSAYPTVVYGRSGVYLTPAQPRITNQVRSAPLENDGGRIGQASRLSRHHRHVRHGIRQQGCTVEGLKG
jgi:hypothetical protein